MPRVTTYRARMLVGLNERATNIAAITLVALTPLSLLKDMSALAFTSLLGCVAVENTALALGGDPHARSPSMHVLTTSLALPHRCVAVVYTALFVAIRAFDGSYALPAGKLLTALPAALTPAFKLASTWKLNAQALVLTSNLGLAYIAHYNAPAFYRSLEHRSDARFGQACL